jgi:hypothetical protein
MRVTRRPSGNVKLDNRLHTCYIGYIVMERMDMDRKELVAAVKRMLADLRDQEETGRCDRTRLQQIIDLDKALTPEEKGKRR